MSQGATAEVQARDLWGCTEGSARELRKNGF
jgi:hypothetical protein